MKYVRITSIFIHCAYNFRKKFVKDYEDLDERLQTLPDKVSYDIMVPICGDIAFAPGKMIHTNEIMVLIGEDYFVERSARQASDIVKRRLKCKYSTVLFIILSLIFWAHLGEPI